MPAFLATPFTLYIQVNLLAVYLYAIAHKWLQLIAELNQLIVIDRDIGWV